MMRRPQTSTLSPYTPLSRSRAHHPASRKLSDIMIRIGIILGSTRPNRSGEQVATWVYDMASRRSDAEFELIDLRDYPLPQDRKSTRLNSSHSQISYAVFCLQ